MVDQMASCAQKETEKKRNMVGLDMHRPPAHCMFQDACEQYLLGSSTHLNHFQGQSI